MKQEMKITKEMMEKFGTYLIEEERSPMTVKKYMRDIRHFYNFLDPDKIITRKKVLNYKSNLITQYKATSANSMLAALNQFLQYIGVSHFKVKKIRVQKSVFREEEGDLTKNEYKLLVEKAYAKGNHRLALIMETICSTGIRISELRYFTVKGIRNGRIEINNKGKVRTILLPEKLRKKLLYYIGKQKILSGSIFITSGGKSVDRSNIWREMKRLGMDAKVLSKKIYPHNLRHLFAKVYYQSYKDLIGLADILGHTSVDTTRIYTITTGREYRRRLEKLQLVS